jgi:hypothetical protein
MTIEQIVDIPADHRVSFEVLIPQEIPSGKARVEMKVIPVVDRQDEGTPQNADEEATSHVDALLGILSQIGGNIDIDELRTERIMAKHLKHLK